MQEGGCNGKRANTPGLAAAVDRIDRIDSAKLLRKNLGDESLEGVFSKDLDKINSLSAFARQHAAIVHDSHASQAIGTLNNIAYEMETQAARSSADYISYRANFLNSVRQHFEDARQWLPLFAGSAVLERGFLEDEGIRREYERVVEDLNAKTKTTLSQVKEQADEAVAEAQKLAEEIEAARPQVGNKNVRRSSSKTVFRGHGRTSKESKDLGLAGCRVSRRTSSAAYRLHVLAVSG